MAYTVKRVAAMSGVSVRTLRFYDETGLLKPAYVGTNGYRFYEEPQLLVLQQILFYREVGFELKQIREILSQDDFEIEAALRSHREVLRKGLARTRGLIETVDKTIEHLRGTKRMQNEEMFKGFVVAADQDRFGERVSLLDEPHDCKVSAKDTGGAMCAFEHNGRSSGPRRFHHEQDAWIYVLGGTVEAQVGDERFRIGAGESAFVPRKVGFAWATPDGEFAKILTVFQPAGTMEEFFREVGSFDSPIHEVLGIPGLKRLFSEHGMTIVGPPLFYNETAE